MSYFILMGRRIPKQAITGFKFQNETDNIRPFLSIRIRGKDEIIPFKVSVYLPMTKTETLFLTPLWNGQGTMRMERWNFSFRCFKC